MKRTLCRMIAAGIALLMLCSLCGCNVLLDYYLDSYDYSGGDYGYDEYSDYYDDTGSDGSDGGALTISSNILGEAIRDKFTKIRGGGNDVVTVMVYMCASNLESESGLATDDIKEMLRATTGSGVNIIIETGGTTKWHASGISSDTNQYHIIKDGEMTTVEPRVGREDMTDPDTLEAFVTYSAQNYPADRYMLILWDHGAGSVEGWGYDEYNYYDTLTIDEMAKALYNTGVKFDFVGFDACLMSTLEVACVLYDFADYMIASEDYESGYGWEYENWLDALASDTSLSTAELGKIICDDFVVESGSEAGIMAIVDLSYMKLVYSTWRDFAYAEKDSLLDANYSWQVEASDRARLNIDDIYGYAEDLLSDETEIQDVLAIANSIEGSQTAPALIAAMENAMIYCSANSGCAQMTGMAVTLPYGDTRTYESIKDVFGNVGFEQQYIEFLGDFVSVSGSGVYDWSDWYDTYDEYGTWSDYYEGGEYSSSDYGWGDWTGWDDYNSDDYGWSDYDYYDYYYGGNDYGYDYYDFYDYGDYGGNYDDYYDYYSYYGGDDYSGGYGDIFDFFGW